MMNATASSSFLQRINWVTTLFLLLTPLVGLIWGALHIYAMGVGASELAVFFFYVCATGFSITTGYHRLFAHGSYECSRVVKIEYVSGENARTISPARSTSASHEASSRKRSSTRNPSRS